MRIARRAGLAICAVLLSLALAGCFAGPRTVSSATVDQRTQEVHNLVNWSRATNGLPPVGWNDKLGGLAATWSEHMATTGQFVHQDLQAVLYSPGFEEFWSLGENILVGPCSMSAQDIHNAWMNSPGHRANILGNYNVGAVALRCNNGRLWAAQEFGRV